MRGPNKREFPDTHHINPAIYALYIAVVAHKNKTKTEGATIRDSKREEENEINYN